MKIDSMDAHVQIHQPSHQPSPQPVTQSVQHQRQETHQVKSSEEAGEEGQKSELGDLVDLASLLQNKTISEMTDVDRQQLSISQKSLVVAIEKANKAVMGRNTSVRFAVHEATHRISVKILDKDTNEVIREIPPEKVLDMIAKMWDEAGLFVDEKR